MPKAPREKSRLSQSRSTNQPTNQPTSQPNTQIVPGSAASAVQSLIQSITGVSNDETAAFAAKLFAGLSNPSSISHPAQPDVQPITKSATQPPGQSTNHPVKQQTKVAKREAKHARLMTKLGLPGSSKPSKPSQVIAPVKPSIDLSELRSQLPISAVLDPNNHAATNQLKTAKSRARLREAEVSQLTAVIKHPSFVASPMLAMRQHLEAMAAKAKREEHQQMVDAKTEAKENAKRDAMVKAVNSAPLGKTAKRRAAKKAKESQNSMFD